MLAVGESLDECEDYFDELIGLTRQYIDFSLQAVDDNSTNLVDSTTLMELMGLIGERSCGTPDELFEDLLKVFSSSSFTISLCIFIYILPLKKPTAL